MAATASPLPQTSALNLSIKMTDQVNNRDYLAQHRHCGKPVQRVHPNGRLSEQGSLPPMELSTKLPNGADPMDLSTNMPDLIMSRKQRVFTSEDSKDIQYWDKRRKNNDAAKRSREKRRLTDLVLETHVMNLARENEKLKAELQAMKGKPCKNKNAKSQNRIHPTSSGKQLGHGIAYPVYEQDLSFFQAPPTTKMYPAEQAKNLLPPYPTSLQPTVRPFMDRLATEIPQRAPVSLPPSMDVNAVHAYLGNSHQLMIKQETPIDQPLVARQPYVGFLNGKTKVTSPSEGPSFSPSLLPSVPPTIQTNPIDAQQKPPSPPSPHSAFSSGIELSKLPHKLRDKLKRSLAQTEEGAVVKTPSTSEEPLCKIKRTVSSEMSSIPIPQRSKVAHEELQCGRPRLDSFTPPPSSSSSDGNISPHPCSSVLEYPVKSEFIPSGSSSELTLNETHERMVEAAQALAALNKGTTEGFPMHGSVRNLQMSMDDSAKYWDKRRRNNQAAKKCRDAKRLLIDYRAARSAYLEQENIQLHHETSSLQKDVARLKELVRRKTAEANKKLSQQ
ncbi:uncharacterized protein [Asterias amurensis]|uniref:uncharacterized protein n=1 Tax=Asterias amurensis TaxID=7602 RepID=UPI003AB61D8C